MSLLIFHYFLDSHSPYFLKKMAYSCSREKHLKWYINVEELKHKAGLRVTLRIIFEVASYFKMLYVASVIRIGFNLKFFWDIFLPSSPVMPTCWLALMRYILNFFYLTSHLFSLRRFGTVETVPIYKWRNDGGRYAI